MGGYRSADYNDGANTFAAHPPFHRNTKHRTSQGPNPCESGPDNRPPVGPSPSDREPQYATNRNSGKSKGRGLWRTETIRQWPRNYRRWRVDTDLYGNTGSPKPWSHLRE